MAGKEIQVLTIYLAAPLFTQAEQRWNLELKTAIEKMSRGKASVTLPQVEAKKFIAGEKINFDGIVQACVEGLKTHAAVVAILDGADPDSGTSFEVGYAAAYRKTQSSRPIVIIGVRTDFRASGEDSKTGVNAMFRLCDEIVYFPPFDLNIENLAQKIIQAIILALQKQTARLT